jgi:hypothetical protein
MELMKLLNISLPKVELILAKVYACSPVEPVSAYDIESKLETSNSRFESVLQEIGLSQNGMLVEVGVK